MSFYKKNSAILSLIILFSWVGVSNAQFIGPTQSPPGGSGVLRASSTTGALEIATTTVSSVQTNFIFKTVGVSRNIIFSPSGKVGIATTTPSEMLEVVGNVKANSFIGSFNGFISAGNVSSGIFGSSAGGGNYAFPLLSSLGIATSSHVGLPATLSVYGNGYFSGNVGIGVPIPGALLDLKPGPSKIRWTSTGLDTATIGYDASSRFTIETVSGGSRNILLNPIGTGNIGIGTSTPAYRLTVLRGGTDPGSPGNVTLYVNYTDSATADGFYVGGAANQYTLAGGSGPYQGARVATYNRMIVADQSTSGGVESQIIGLYNSIDLRNAGTITSAAGVHSEMAAWGAGSGVNMLIGAYYKAETPVGFSATKTITNLYGFQIKPLKVTGVGNAWGIYQEGTSDNNYFAGNVGIGTTTPAYKLDVQGGNINAPGICIAGVCQTSWPSGGGTNYWTLSGSSLSPTSTAYNVGIGTLTPGVKLDVSGTVRGSNLALGTGSTNTNYKLTVGSNNTGQGFPMVYFMETTQGISNSIYAMRTQNTGGATVGYTAYGITGESTGAGGGTNTGGYFSASGNTQNRGIQIGVSSGASNYSIYSGGTAQSYFAGNVGIATTTSNYPLTVNGVIYSATGGFRFPDGSTQTTAATAGTNYWTLSGSSLSPTSTAYNVGIGTLTPQAKLDVSGNAFLGGSNLDPAGANISFLANTGKVLIGWNRSAGSGETDFIANRGGGSAGGFRFIDYTNSGVENILVTMAGGGNVGIGTTNITSKLTVANNADALFSLNRPGATYPTDFKMGTDGALVVNNGGVDIVTLKNGNVGIGTLTPGVKLHVVGNAIADTPKDYTHLAVYRDVSRDRGWTGTFQSLTPAPSTVSDGGSLVYTGGDFIYALRGNYTNSFWRYSISGNSWTNMTVAPGVIGSGGSLVYTGGDFIYASQGETNSFWRYSISGNSWTNMTVAPDVFSIGGSLVYTGGDFIYALRGFSNSFWRYSISGNSWTNMTVAPANIGGGGSLVYTGGDFIYALRGGTTNSFWRYSISDNSWTNMTVTPANVIWGGSLVYTGGDFIYALRGGTTNSFWRYSISGNSWTDMTITPANVSEGGSLVYTGGDFIYAFQGNNATTFWRIRLDKPSAWQPWMR